MTISNAAPVSAPIIQTALADPREGLINKMSSAAAVNGVMKMPAH